MVSALLASAWLLGTPPYPESWGVAETGSTSETNSVVMEGLLELEPAGYPVVVVMAREVTVETKLAVLSGDTAEALPRVLVPTDTGLGTWVAVEPANEGLGKLLCCELRRADVCFV
jgi:hypothetical protein